MTVMIPSTDVNTGRGCRTTNAVQVCRPNAPIVASTGAEVPRQKVGGRAVPDSRSLLDKRHIREALSPCLGDNNRRDKH